MSFRVIRFESTPNPNAVKCVLDRQICEGSRSFRTAEAALSDPLAKLLFGIEGVAGILMNSDWITINKSPDSSWAQIKRAVKQVLLDA